MSRRDVSECTPLIAGSRALVLGCLITALAAPISADQWIVYIGGGLEALEGGWTERRGQVVFHQPGGMLASVPHHEVDLPTSAMISFQLSGRREPPPQGSLDDAPPELEQGESEADCIAARLVGLRDSETLDVRVGDTIETVHAACLDAPDTHHRYPQLGWFGRATRSAIELELESGAEVCLSDHQPPLRDREGHRVVYITLAEGHDYAGEVIGGGLGMLRTGTCGRQRHYRALENRAIAQGRGLWGEMSERPAIAAANLAVSIGGSPSLIRPPGQRSAGGG